MTDDRSRFYVVKPDASHQDNAGRLEEVLAMAEEGGYGETGYGPEELGQEEEGSKGARESYVEEAAKVMAKLGALSGMVREGLDSGATMPNAIEYQILMNQVAMMNALGWLVREVGVMASWAVKER